MKRKIVVSAAAAMLAVIAIVAVMQLVGNGFDDPGMGATVVHAAAGDAGSGCAKCHSDPIAGACLTCHPAPPVQLVDKVSKITISFPHHNTAPGGVAPNACQLCHVSADNDARNVTVPDMKHDFCGKCHQLKHA